MSRIRVHVDMKLELDVEGEFSTSAIVEIVGEKDMQSIETKITQLVKVAEFPPKGQAERTWVSILSAFGTLLNLFLGLFGLLR